MAKCSACCEATLAKRLRRSVEGQHLFSQTMYTARVTVVQVDAAIEDDKNTINVAPRLKEDIALVDTNLMGACQQQTRRKCWPLV